MPDNAPEIQLIELECPNCHAPLKGRASANILACEYCGTQVKVVQKHSHSDGAVPIRDESGRVLIHTMMPFDWRTLTARLDPAQASGDWPWRIRVELTDDAGTHICYESPTDRVNHCEYMKGILRTYGNGAINAAEPVNEPFHTPAEFYQNMMFYELGQQRAATARYMGQIPNPFSAEATRQIETACADQCRRELEQLAARSNVAASVAAIYSKALTRLYAFDLNGQDYRIAIYAFIVASKVNLPHFAGGLGMMGGGLLGGLLGNIMGGGQQQPQYGQARGFAPQGFGQPAPNVPGMMEDAEAAQFAQQGNSQDISWTIRDYYVLISPAEKFDSMYKGIFADIVANTKIDDALTAQRAIANANTQANLDASVRDFKARSNAQLQQSLEYSRQQNAMMDARMESWQRQSDAHHQAVMERSRAMFGDTSGGSMSTADKWSEAILGQNTYVDQYGDEHSVSNRWDEAWRSDSGDIIGTERGVDPGYGWTKLDKK